MTETTLMCANHPSTPTQLRCNRCGKPICNRCAVLTPVGYRCRECVRGQQAVFETAKTRDYPVAAVIAAVGTPVAATFLNFLWIWGFLVAPLVGGALAEVIRWAVGRRRSRYLGRWAVAGGVLGMLPILALPLINVVAVLAGGGNLGMLGGVLLAAAFPVVFGALTISALYWRLHGIRL